MSNDNDSMKRLLDGILLGERPFCVKEVFDNLKTACESKRIEYDETAALEYWWTLARLGVVALPGAALDEHITVVHGARLLKVAVTERGKKLLERGEQSPHDPPKYLDAVRRRVESPDAIVMTYVNEAVGAWVAGLYRASAVMLGCACERLVLMLADRIASADLPPWSARLDKKLKGAIAGVSEIFEIVRNCLTQLPGGKVLPGALSDALDRKLSAIFDHARGLRNKSGHPTEDDVSADDAEAGLLMFPGFYGFVNDLCKNLMTGKPDNGASA